MRCNILKFARKSPRISISYATLYYCFSRFDFSDNVPNKKSEKKPGAVAPIYTYSLSKGLYAGISLDGKVIIKRDRVNEKFYGREISGAQFLTGEIVSPPAARPLYDALQRCHVYARNDHSYNSTTNAFTNYRSSNTAHTMQGYPEIPSATHDQHSYTGISDITADQSF